MTVEFEPCTNGQTTPCYDGPAGTKDVGICRAGTATCSNGQWGPACEGQVLPQTRICNGQDNDCDGHIDCECTDGQTQPCSYSGPAGTENVGICRAGIRTCTNGEWNVACQGEVLPQQEIWDGLDNNCNGQIDEGFACTYGQTRSCYDGPAGSEGKGICHGGTQTCISSQWDTTCIGEVLPEQEKCDGMDHNCNGQVDEGCDQCQDDTGNGSSGTWPFDTSTSWPFD